jgi:hypothetical protein
MHFKRTPLLAIAAAAATIAAGAPAQAEKPIKPPSAHEQKPAKAKPKPCKTRSVGYRASGTLVSATLTPGARKGRYSGTLVVKVTRVNHHGATGEESYVLTNARVKFRHGVDKAAPAVGSRVTVHGKRTTQRNGCDPYFLPATTITKAEIAKAKAKAS